VRTFDGAGRLATSVWGTVSASYQYNAFGQRVRKTVNGVVTRFVYGLDGKLLGEYDAAGQPLREYVWLNDTPVAVLVYSGQTYQSYWIQADHLDTPREVHNGQGQVVWRWEGEPFGNSPPDENPSGLGTFSLNLRFPGQYLDQESNLHYNYYRDYDPLTGRYVESDPIGLDGGINPYAYVGSSPLSNADQLGLMGRGGIPSSVARAVPGRVPRPAQPDAPWPVTWPPPSCPPGGCGSGWNENVVPDVYPEACRRHDQCYATPGRSKLSCDWDFFRDSFGESGPQPNVLGPFIYFLGPLLGGGSAYREAQIGVSAP
jgi:RHS repeat-associated protein